MVFGGRCQDTANGQPTSRVLDDVRLFDLGEGRWLPTSASRAHKSAGGHPLLSVKARCGHLSAVSGNRLFIFGGQDVGNVWIEVRSICRSYIVTENAAVSDARQIVVES